MSRRHHDEDAGNGRSHSESRHPVIATRVGLETLVDRLLDRAEIGLDCEFHGEGRYQPQLCLVQVAWDGGLAAIDPFEVDLAPLGPLLENDRIVKVLHAALNDIPLLVSATGHPVRNVFDTQIAGAFAGQGATPAYTALVHNLRGVSLSKKSRFTDWTVRPLSDDQVEYALDDVRHLLDVARALRDRLSRSGRSAWADEVTREMVERAHTPRDRDRLWLRLGPHKGMTSRQLAVLREVAAWRDRRAEAINKPLSTVAPDDAIRQVVFDLPETVRDVLAMRGMQRVGSNGAEGLLEAIRRGLELPDDRCPPVVTVPRRDDRVDAVAHLLTTALKARAGTIGVAQTMIATRDQVEQLVAWHFGDRPEPADGIALLTSWRREAAGDLLLSFLEGHVGLRVDAASDDGVALVPLDVSGAAVT